MKNLLALFAVAVTACMVAAPRPAGPPPGSPPPQNEPPVATLSNASCPPGESCALTCPQGGCQRRVRRHVQRRWLHHRVPARRVVPGHVLGRWLPHDVRGERALLDDLQRRRLPERLRRGFAVQRDLQRRRLQLTWALRVERDLAGPGLRLPRDRGRGHGAKLART